jgi:type II restriction enzyme
MNLSMTGELATAYKSSSQKAGNVTEAWGAENFYCPNCSSPKLDWLKPGTKAKDYRCPSCRFGYQLKSQKTPIGSSITDGAYSAMMEAIRDDEMPSFFFLHYDLETWRVRNLLLVPHFAFPPSAIIRRKPLAPTARRHGWVGCNFALNRIPVEARIPLVITRSSGRESAPNSLNEGRESQSRLTSAATIIIPPEEVREKFKRVKPLKEIGVKERGWTLDVLNIVRRISDGRDGALRRPRSSQRDAPTNTFTTSDVYAFERELEKLHPDNRHVKDKIRQQLQVLRDMGLLQHIERGFWRLP